MKKARKRTPKLPKTDPIQELAEFLDTHDLTDFEAQLEEVAEPVFERKSALILHLPPSEAEAVRQLAQTKGVAEEDLIREWVLESYKLRSDAKPPDKHGWPGAADVPRRSRRSR